ncbi:hypothetical protein like AT3G15720 [Hibiscus trionum]|uniref:Polygalacturonase n=1 Tax=Hibiscus trionum TaxID=183268 RepID=A0A9W7HJQ0_HIBTR|nr:hypothetical protein like AT3G15720 [Hibiscus trionum]
MKFGFSFTVFLLIGFALGNENFSQETIAAFNLDMGNEILSEEISSSFNVMHYGAVGNGQVDDSQAFNKAWGAVCSAKVGEGIATLVVPQGKTFLLSPLKFQGPCQAKSIHFQLGGTLTAPQSISWANGQVNVWLQFSSVENLILDGDGTIDGQGFHWWQPCIKTSIFGSFFNCARRPGALNFHDCNGLRLKGLTHLNSPRTHIAINECKNVVISDLRVKAPEDSPNTDGIDISRSTNVQIQDSTIETGDDCVAINGGSSFINITGVNCGPGHGISVGSLGDGSYDTVEEVHVRNCNFSNTQNGVRIKTFQGGSGFARKISFEHSFFNNVDNPIVINQFYQNKAKLRSHGIWQKAAAVQVSDVTYSDLQGTSAGDRAIDLNCDNVVGCSNIVISNVRITSGNGAKIYGSCNNAHGTAMNVQPAVPCMS